MKKSLISVVLLVAISAWAQAPPVSVTSTSSVPESLATVAIKEATPATEMNAASVDQSTAKSAVSVLAGKVGGGSSDILSAVRKDGQVGSRKMVVAVNANGGGSIVIIARHGGESGGITSAPGQGFMPNERMLN